MRPLPLAPRPKPGEAPSSWAWRLAARYDLPLAGLIAAIGGADAIPLDEPPEDRLDRGGWPALDHALARVARLAPAAVTALRPIARPEHAGWFRRRPGWCPRCLEEDVAREGEVHLRASWRTGAHAACERHAVRLRSAEGWGLSRDGGLGFGLIVREGRLRSVLGSREADPPSDTDGTGIAERGRDGALADVVILQDMLARALEGREPPTGWHGLVPPASLPAACASIAEALDPTEPPPGERSIYGCYDLLAACVSILGLGRAASSDEAWRVVPPALARRRPPFDLAALVVAIGAAGRERLAAGAALVGGPFAAAVASAVAWARLTRLAGGKSSMGEPEEEPWPVTLLQDPAAAQALAGLESYRRERGLDCLARHVLAAARRSCLETGAMQEGRGSGRPRRAAPQLRRVFGNEGKVLADEGRTARG